MGRVVITIQDIVAGKGLNASPQPSGPPAIDVECGRGVCIGNDEAVEVKVGPGLGFNEDGELVLSSVELAGEGMVAGHGTQINIDTAADPAMRQSFRVVRENKFAMDGYGLVFCTTYTHLIVHRNAAGVVLGVEEGERVTEQQPLNFDGYGYGSGPPVATPKIPGKPSFYKS